MAIVTISSELGSGGPEIGMAVARAVGYRFIDREVIAEAASRYGLAEKKLAGLDERKPSLFQRFDTETRHYMLGTQAALCEFAAADDVVLIGRGGQWLLREIPHVLKVRVTAPFELRVKRLAARQGRDRAKSALPRSLVEMVRADDAGRAGRTRYLYNIDIDDASLYDVVINTTTIANEVAVALLVAGLEQPDLATTDVGRRLVQDRILAAKVEVTLAAHPKTRKMAISVEASDGAVILESTAELGDAVAIARGVPGVRHVVPRRRETPPPPPVRA